MEKIELTPEQKKRLVAGTGWLNMNNTKPFWKSSTVWFNAIAGIVDLAQELTGMFPSGKFHQYLAVALFVGNFLLRFKTSTVITSS